MGTRVAPFSPVGCLEKDGQNEHQRKIQAVASIYT